MPSQTIYYIPDNLVADGSTSGTGTDNAPAIQAAIATGLPVIIPPGQYLIKSTINLNPANGHSLGGTFGGTLGPDDPSKGTALIWGGSANGTSILMKGIKSRLHDLWLGSATNTSLTQCVDVETPNVYPNTSSQHRFERIACDGRNGAVANGWMVGQDNLSNNEFHQWESCVTRYCTVAGINVPNSTRQCKDLTCTDCTFGGSQSFTDIGVSFNSGSMKFNRVNFDSLGIGAKWFGAANEPVTFLNCTGETNKQWFVGPGVSYLNLIGCRLATNGAANPQVSGQEFINGGNNWLVAGCDFEDTINHYLRPTSGASVVLGSNQFNQAEPFTTDDTTRFRLSSLGSRVSLDNLLMEGGSYWQDNVPGLANGGGGVLLWDGHWPPKGTFAGGSYEPAFGEARLYIDGAGVLWLKVGTNAPRQIQLI